MYVFPQRFPKRNPKELSSRLPKKPSLNGGLSLCCRKRLSSRFLQELSVARPKGPKSSQPQKIPQKKPKKKLSIAASPLHHQLLHLEVLHQFCSFLLRYRLA